MGKNTETSTHDNLGSKNISTKTYRSKEVWILRKIITDVRNIKYNNSPMEHKIIRLNVTVDSVDETDENINPFKHPFQANNPPRLFWWLSNKVATHFGRWQEG